MEFQIRIINLLTPNEVGGNNFEQRTGEILLSKLRELYSTNNLESLTDIRISTDLPIIHPVIQRLTSLQYLALTKGVIFRIENLEGLHSLRVLDLTRNRIEEIEGLEFAHNLEALILDGNPLCSLTPLSLLGLKNVKHLSLCGTRITNLFTTVRALSVLPKLESVNFIRTQSSPVAQQPNLPHIENQEQIMDLDVILPIQMQLTSRQISNEYENENNTAPENSTTYPIEDVESSSDDDLEHGSVSSFGSGSVGTNYSAFSQLSTIAMHDDTEVPNHTHEVISGEERRMRLNWRSESSRRERNENRLRVRWTGDVYGNAERVEEENEFDYQATLQPLLTATSSISSQDVFPNESQNPASAILDSDGFQPQNSTILTDTDDDTSENNPEDTSSDGNSEANEHEQVVDSSESESDNDDVDFIEWLNVNGYNLPNKPSPIGSNEQYREYIIAKLQKLKILDGKEITDQEREDARRVISEKFEERPCTVKNPPNFTSLLLNREIGWKTSLIKNRTLSSHSPNPNPIIKRSASPMNVPSSSSSSSSSSLSNNNYHVNNSNNNNNNNNNQSKVDSVNASSSTLKYSIKPSSHTSETKFRFDIDTQMKNRTVHTAHTPPSFQSYCYDRLLHVDRPSFSRVNIRHHTVPQFEYHPNIPEYLVYGTVTGQVVVTNHETNNFIAESTFTNITNVLGLCWLRSPSSAHKFIAGTEAGDISLFDIPTLKKNGQATMSFPKFTGLTSLHINSNDTSFIVSGKDTGIVMYDLNEGRVSRNYQGIHSKHINVLKYSHHSPWLFATSSFDCDVKLWDSRVSETRPIYTCRSDRGNVMVVFSPDDKKLLVSAIDNSVKQYHSNDGRLDIDFKMRKRDSLKNYTRSYYMNHGDYVVSGSIEESSVRIYCARDGKFFNEVEILVAPTDQDAYIQSLRGDPNNPYQFAVLLVHANIFYSTQLIKVNLLGGY